MAKVTRACQYTAVDRSAYLANALDPRAVRAALKRSWTMDNTADPVRVEIDRVHFSARRPPSIHYLVHRVGRPEPDLVLAELIGLDAAAHAEMECTRLAKSRRGQIAKNAHGRIVADGQTGLVFRRPGLDAKLPGLRLLTDPCFAAAIAADMLGVRSSSLTAHVTLRSHRLGKRAVLQIELEGSATRRCVFARLHPTKNDDGSLAYEQHRRIADALAGSGRINVPQPLCYHPELGCGLFSALPGSAPEFSGVDGFRSIYHAMAALEAFQESRVELQRQHLIADERAILERSVAHVASLLPDLGLLATPALESVSQDLDEIPYAKPIPCHRDMHEGQVLIGETKAGLLDFDTACMADAMLDIGNLAAHIRLAGLRGDRSLAAFEQAAERGPSGRRTASERRRISVWKRAALLRLGCIYALTSVDPKIPRELIKVALR